MAGLSPLPRMIFWDANGNPVASGSQLFTYVAGSSTPLPTYTDQSGGTPNVNPLDLDGASGDNIWFKGAYKIDVKDQDGVSLPGYPVDNVVVYDLLDWSGLTATIADLNATDTSTVPITSSTYAITLSNRGKTLLCDTSLNAITINLLEAATATNGYQITIKKTNVSPTNFVTIDGFNSETIEGRLTFILYDQNDVVTILCDGNNWRIKSAVIRGNVEYKSDAFTTTISDINKFFVCTAASADYTVTLLSAVTAGDGFRQTFKKSADTFNITIAPAGAETIDGQATFVLTSPYQAVSIISDGANWLIESEDSSRIIPTGSVIFSIQSIMAGWVILNDGTIGSATSGATTRANADTQDLFEFIWDNITDSFCPVSGGRGASADADFTANKTIRLPLSRGRTFGATGAGTIPLTFTATAASDLLTVSSTESLYTGAVIQVSNSGGALPNPLVAATNYYVINISSTTIKLATSLANAVGGVPINITTDGTGTQTLTLTLSTRALAEYLGEEYHALTVAETPAHTHIIVLSDTTGDGQEPQGDLNNAAGVGTTESTGGSGAHNNMQPTVFFNAFIKL